MDSKHYTALVSPDAYEYLDETTDEELLHDSLLEEQEMLEDSDLYYDDDDESPLEEDLDDSDMYEHNSLFDEFEEEVDSSEEQVNENEIKDSVQLFEDDEDDDIYVSDISTLENLNVFVASLIKKLGEFDLAAQYLKKLDRNVQDQVEQVISDARGKWLIDHKDKMFSIPQIPVSVALISKTDDPMIQIQRLENIGAVMVANNQEKWAAVFLTYDTEGILIDVSSFDLAKSTFTDWQWKTVLQRGERLKALMK